MTAPFLSTVPAGTRKAEAVSFQAESPVAAHPFAIKADEVVDGRYTYGQLRAAFAAIQDAEDWKNPIRVAIPAALLDVASSACAFFAGSRLTVEAATADRYAVVTAPGYYTTIGA
jgi:hypothetical protein